MAKISASAVPPQVMPIAAAVVAPVRAKASAKAPHGMSLKARPERPAHAVHRNRDAYGRMLPGNLPPNAAPPFQLRNIPAQAPVTPPRRVKG